MAAEGKLEVVIVTPAGEKFSGVVDEIVAPGHLGEFGVMPGHIEFFTNNPPGVLTVIEGGSRTVWSIGKGFIEVGPDHVQFIVQSAERASDIDADRASKSHEKAVAAMAELDGNLDDPVWAEHNLRLKRSEARMQAIDANR